MNKIYKSNGFGNFEVFDDFIIRRTKTKGTSIRKYRIKFLDTCYYSYAAISDIKKGCVRDLTYPIKDLLGKELNSTQDGKIIVLPEVLFNEKIKRNTYKVKFLDTGNLRFFTKKEILTGKVKDLYKPRIFDVACIGKASKKENYKLYSIWYQMISRCYNKNHKRYKEYGGKGVTVSKEWHCFENFLNTVIDVENYNLEMISNTKKGLNLDKDFLQLNKENKIYSKETCVFVTNIMNQRIRKLENELKNNKDIVQTLI